MSRRVRARDLGIPFKGTPGNFNSITDVQGVEVGHRTLIENSSTNQRKSVRTGVTVILPRGKNLGGNLEEKKLFGGWYSLNGNGEMTGTTWLDESGLLAPLIAITNTHSVGTIRDAAIQWFIQQKSTEAALSDGVYSSLSLPIVTETWDGFLNDINGFHVKGEHLFEAIQSASTGIIEEGNVGGGTGMITHQFKGGIGTSSRKYDQYTVGVLVQSNYGIRNQLTISGIPLGEIMSNELLPFYGQGSKTIGEVGSIIVIVATDAPLLPHQLKRLVRRVPIGIGLVGGRGGNSSGDIFLAFSTANQQIMGKETGVVQVDMLPNEQMDRLFESVVQATEEAILNAMVAAETMEGIYGNKVYAIPHEKIKEILKKYNKL
ncbi:hypothetical protein I4U23_027750 [Adineta vaga]|nr:hypothetical protein I4U23_027750 [Adineta vaga]